MFYDMQKIAQSRTFRKLPEISPVHSFPSISPKRSKQLVYVNTNLQQILKGGNCLRSKFKILKGENSFGEQILPLKDRKTAIFNAQNIRMLQTHVNNNVYNKYYFIHNMVS